MKCSMSATLSALNRAVKDLPPEEREKYVERLREVLVGQNFVTEDMLSRFDSEFEKMLDACRSEVALGKSPEAAVREVGNKFRSIILCGGECR